MSQKCSYKGCKGKVVGAYTVDLDIKGLPYCKGHKEMVKTAFLWLIMGIPEMSESCLNNDKRPLKNKHKK